MFSKKCLSVINDGKFAPVYDENETMTVECDRLIFAIGQQSVWKDLLKGEDVKFNGPAIELNQVTFQSSKEDIFAGGDVYTGPKFAIDAIAQGKIAAESLHRYVHNGHMETGRNRWQFKQLDTDDILVESYDRGPKQVEGINPEVKDRFKDNTQILTEEQIRKETARCLGCGAQSLMRINVLVVGYVQLNVNLMLSNFIVIIQNVLIWLWQKISLKQLSLIN